MDDQALTVSIALIIFSIVVTLFFSWSVYTTLKRIPKENLKVPSWIIWLFCIPILGFFIQWVMLPFLIPKALSKSLSHNLDAVESANILFMVALSSMIITTFAIFFSVDPIDKIADLTGWILWFVYWVLIIRFRKKYL